MKVIVTEIFPVDPDFIKAMEPIAEVVSTNRFTEADMLEHAKDADAFLLGHESKVTRRVLESAKRLKVAMRFGVGYDNVDVKAATDCGILAVNFPGIYNQEVAEITIALMFALARNLTRVDRLVKAKDWVWNKPPEERDKWLGMTLKGKTLGLIGLGGIGTEVARMAKVALDMKLLVYDPYINEEKAKSVGGSLVPLERLLQESDIVSLHIPLNEQTRGFMGSKQLGMMKKSAFLINTSRGGVIDEAALIEALRQGKIAGAGLDVMSPEPPKPDNPLLEMENVILTSHTAAMTREGFKRVWMASAESITRIFQGKAPLPPANVLNPEVLKARGYTR
jgi:D-3-phosphoglycerate dehydrogenase